MNTRREVLASLIGEALDAEFGAPKLRHLEQAEFVADAIIAWERNREPSPAEIEAGTVAAIHKCRALKCSPGKVGSAGQWGLIIAEAVIAARDARVSEVST